MCPFSSISVVSVLLDARRWCGVPWRTRLGAFVLAVGLGCLCCIHGASGDAIDQDWGLQGSTADIPVDWLSAVKQKIAAQEYQVTWQEHTAFRDLPRPIRRPIGRRTSGLTSRR